MRIVSTDVLNSQLRPPDLSRLLLLLILSKKEKSAKLDQRKNLKLDTLRLARIVYLAPIYSLLSMCVVVYTVSFNSSRKRVI